MLNSDELDDSSTKAKFSVTPPSSPTSSFTYNQNVYNNNAYSSSPRLASDGSESGVDGVFKFLGDDYPDVFTISNGNVNNETLSRAKKPPRSPKPDSGEGTLPGTRGSNFSENKYKWTDSDTCPNSDKTKKTHNSRKICLIVFVVLLILALVGVGIAVILVYKVFDVGEADLVVAPTESPEILTLEGSLDLKATWTIELSDKNSTLFKETTENFTQEMDRLMADSPFNDSYIRTVVLEMSKGSIKVKYNLLHNSRYKIITRSPPEFAVKVENHIKQKSPTSELPIDKDTIELYVKPSKGTTQSPPPSSTSSPTTAPDRPPVANAGQDVEITLPTNTVELDGSASTDDHGIVSYQWEKDSPKGVNVVMEGTTSARVTIRSLVQGVFVFRLTVKDKAGQIAEDLVKVNVKPAPITPTPTTVSTTPQQDLCLPVNFTTCLDLGFTSTVFPNLFQQTSMDDAITAFGHTAASLYNTVCRDMALTYLCSLYFPKCDPATGYIVFPCNSLCTQAVGSCGDFFINPFSCEYFTEDACVAMPTTTVAPTTPQQVCEMTQLRQCVDIGFNVTQFPNFINEPTQSGALETFTYFEGDVSSGCHPDALYFICSLQFPLCVSGVKVKPCRRTCEAVRANCSMMQLILTSCEGFPDIDCMAPHIPEAVIVPRKMKKCGKDKFSCKKTGKCVLSDKVCDRTNDCGDWSDEMDCTCGYYDFQCEMGMCIKSYERCDGVSQCPDSSDEHNCENCTHGQVKCPNEDKCIMREWMCDGRNECADGWDEYNCDLCGRNQFTCMDREHTCIPLSKRCDMVDDCPDGYDEWECIDNTNGFLQLRYRKYWVPVCSEFWDDSYGNDTCTRLLGEGPYIGKEDVPQNVYSFIKLGSGDKMSVLGKFEITNECQDRKVVKVNCEPRGCGKRFIGKELNHVVNGEVAPPGKWPWHVALYYAGQYFCGGTLINENFVLTAAHCVDDFIYSQYNLMTVKLGANSREEEETTQHVIKVEAIESHSEHVYFKKNDIALLQLENPVTYTNFIQPVCLPEVGDHLPLHSECYTVGWGKTKWDGDYAEVLQELKMTLWDTQKCNSSIAWNGEVYDTFLCAGYYSGIRSICKGDSGGALICRDKQQTWKLFGVASYVANFCNMTERPNIYTNVTQLLPWIDEKLECKFRCDNGKCLYYKEYICDRIDHCGDNSDETRLCNRTVSCDFEDAYLCGYNYSGWLLGYDNKQAASIQIDGQWHTQSNTPQYDHTLGRYPGQFFYGKNKDVRDAELLSPWFNLTGQTCIRFAYYQRGEIKLGMSVYVLWGNINDQTRPWHSGAYYAIDEWKTGYLDLTLGRYQLIFKTGDLLKTAIDDIIAIPGMCSEVLCNENEFRCKGKLGDKCIPTSSKCNLAIDCDEFEYNRQADELSCTSSFSKYICTFDNGNICALHQEVGDASDWWLVNASFVRKETRKSDFVDHTTLQEDGHVFYINAYGLSSGKQITMWQMFYLHSQQYCFSFYYNMKSNVTFNIHIDCDGCITDTHLAQSTFEDHWTLFQLNLPQVQVVNLTYDVEGNSHSDGIFRGSFIAIDDISVKPGLCPDYECRANYTKCRSTARCIPQTALCNRVVDCTDESDEEQCACTPDEYKCTRGRCIPASYLCDRTSQCLDGSDEGTVCLPLQKVSCTFEHPYMCGYQLVQYTDFRWKRHNAHTPTPVTGPMNDHTFGTAGGYYMYTEMNQGRRGDNASMISPSFNTGFGRSILFFYHMYASTADTRPGDLLFTFEDTESNVLTQQWKANVTDLEDRWRPVCVDLPNNRNLRLHFTVKRTEVSTYGVDMAIDDVTLQSHSCADSTVTTMRPTTTNSGTSTPHFGSDSCPSNEFQCNDESCVSLEYVCDGEPDCFDGSDEYGCK